MCFTTIKKNQVKHLEQCLPGASSVRCRDSLPVFVLREHVLNLLPHSTPLLCSLQAASSHPALHPGHPRPVLERKLRGTVFRVLSISTRQEAILKWGLPTHWGSTCRGPHSLLRSMFTGISELLTPRQGAALHLLSNPEFHSFIHFIHSFHRL